LLAAFCEQNLGICAMARNPPELDLSSDYSSEEGGMMLLLDEKQMHEKITT